MPVQVLEYDWFEKCTVCLFVINQPRRAPFSLTFEDDFDPILVTLFIPVEDPSFPEVAFHPQTTDILR